MQLKHPHLWTSTAKEEDNKIKEGEIVRSLYLIQLKSKQQGKLDEMILYVTETKEKALLHAGSVHIEEGKTFCAGHVATVAEYPIEEINTLLEEANELVLFRMEKLKDENDVPLKPIIAIPKIPKDIGNENLHKVLQKIPINTDIEQQIIKEMISTNKKKKEEKIEIITITATMEEKEESLVKKFGKKKIEKLAREIGYKGIKINNKKQCPEQKNNHTKEAKDSQNHAETTAPADVQSQKTSKKTNSSKK